MIFRKAGPDQYRELLDGVRLKALVHGERTHLTEVKLKKGAIVPEHQVVVEVFSSVRKDYLDSETK